MKAWEQLHAELKRIEPKIDQIKISLEDYLRALKGLALENKQESPSLDFFLKLFKKSFIAKPMDFDENWLAVVDPPIEDYDIDLSDLENGIELVKKKEQNPEEEFNFLMEVLKFQIAEVHRLQDKELDQKGKYFGVESDSGHHWYHFEAFSLVEAGVRGYIDNIENGTQAEGPITWRTMGEILEIGRIYE